MTTPDRWNIRPPRPPAHTARYRQVTALHAQVDALTADHPRLATAADDLAHCLPLWETATRRLWDARAALPGAASLDGCHGGGSGDTATERHALTGDRTQADRDALDRALRQIEVALATGTHKRIDPAARTLRAIVNAWTPKAANPRQKAAVERANTGTPECHHTRETLGLFVAAHRTSDLRGLLPEPMPVGRWVYRFASDHRRMPTPLEMRRWASLDDELRSQLITAVKAGAR